MNRILLVIISFLLAFPMSMDAQDNRREQIKSLKIAFLTERLELTNEEAQKFWPIYNKFEEQFDELRSKERKLKQTTDLQSISDSEASTLLKELMNQEDQKLLLKKNFIRDLSTTLSDRKILLLKKAEEDFKRRMIDEFRKRKHNNRKN